MVYVPGLVDWGTVTRIVLEVASQPYSQALE